MSVTISIVNNVQHCERKHLVEKHVHECTCVCEGQSEPNCWICKGTGEWEESVYPFEINLANRNFVILWQAIGMKFDANDLYGMVDGRVLKRAIRSIDVQSVVREPVQQENYLVFGISPAQVDNYIEQLTKIALEAERRESNVCWG